MCKLEKEWKDALFWAILQVNLQMIEHQSYFLVKIITKIQPLISIEYKI